jgi:tRNA(Ile)-lysidine synthase TilS/MesJ
VKCRSCRGPAVIEIRRHHAAFCTEHFFSMFRTQVEKAIRRFHMMEPDDRIIVAVSGGKDSLALWDVLLGLGYDVTGLFLGLGIGEYSDRSHDVAQA